MPRKTTDFNTVGRGPGPAPPGRTRWRLSAMCLALKCFGIAPAFAQSSGVVDPNIVRQIEALKAQQAQIAQLQHQTDASIRALEAKLGVVSDLPASTPAATVAATARPATP